MEDEERARVAGPHEAKFKKKRVEPITTWQNIKIIGKEKRSETQWGKNKIGLKQEAANPNLQSCCSQWRFNY